MRLRASVVDPAFHGKGIGSALLDHCINTARRQNYGRIHLHTSTAMEVALPLYLRRGFTYPSLCAWVVLLAVLVAGLEGAGRAVNYIIVAVALVLPGVVYRMARFLVEKNWYLLE